MYKIKGNKKSFFHAFQLTQFIKIREFMAKTTSFLLLLYLEFF
jgi:hypothetical protein